jgi:hypothetical protein
MRPVRRIPPLTTVNGIGTTLIGNRDFDNETGTYVKTLVVTILFLPLIALGAYRVADAASGGFYFIGKVPLSGFARACNAVLLLMVLGLAGFIGWHEYTDSADYKAGQTLAEADRLVAAGHAGKAAQLYGDLLIGNTSSARPAREKLIHLIDNPPDSAAEVLAVLKVAADLQSRGQLDIADLAARGTALAERHIQDAPTEALALLDVVAPFSDKPQDILAVRRKLLEQTFAKNPKDVDTATRLAAVCKAQGDLARCEAILSPLADKLGAGEGAAILGHVYASKGQHARAISLLEPYVQAHLPRLHEAHKTLNALQERVITQIKNGTAPGFDYQRFEGSTPKQRIQLFQDYLMQRINEDPAAATAEKDRNAEMEAAQWALELGIVQVSHAQSLTEADPATRKRELQKAEKTLLSIKDVAGETDAYRLQLGRVYYWLGKSADGRKLLDELLAAHSRGSKTLAEVARALREVGEVATARSLMEEAYNKEVDGAQKQFYALGRSILSRDLDDEIAWLGKANDNSLEVRALLGSARGRKAEEDGKDDEAQRHYRESLEAYAAMPESVGTLNNSALNHLALFRLTRAPDQLAEASRKLDRAATLQPDDSIILRNAADSLLQSAAQDLIGPAVDLKVLKRDAGLDLLSFLYRDEKGKAEWIAKLRRQPGITRARGYYEKLLVLAPKDVYPYPSLVQLHNWMNDAQAMEALRRRLQGVELDLTDYRKESVDYWKGKEDAKKRDELKKTLARRQDRLADAKNAGGATFAAAVAALINTRIAGDTLEPVADVDNLVHLAEQADATAPSAGTQGTLVGVLLFRAHKTLVKEDRDYAALAERTRRSLGSYLVNYVLGRGGPLREKALANADVKRALALELERLKAIPDHADSEVWARLRGAYPEEAEKVAKAVRADPLEEPQRAIELTIAPLSAAAVLHSHWLLLLSGNEKEAAAVLKRAAEQGVPLPDAQ